MVDMNNYGHMLGFAKRFIAVADEVTAKDPKARPTVGQLNELLSMAQEAVAVDSDGPYAKYAAKAFVGEDFDAPSKDYYAAVTKVFTRAQFSTSSEEIKHQIRMMDAQLSPMGASLLWEAFSHVSGNAK